MSRWIKRILAVAAGLGGASVFAKRRKQQAWENEPRSPAEWPPLEMAAKAKSPGSEAKWVEPTDDGECPDGYPIKANNRSKIFHVEGNFAYARTKPNRCYASAADAEADGYRAAKS